MLATLRIFKAESLIIEPKIALENKPDLRLSSPWPALLEYCNKYDFATMEQNDHNHTPYGAILIQAIVKWREGHDGKLPKTMADKDQFRAMIKTMRRNGGSENFNGENFDEAIKNAHRCFSEHEIES